MWYTASYLIQVATGMITQDSIALVPHLKGRLVRGNLIVVTQEGLDTHSYDAVIL